MKKNIEYSAKKAYYGSDSAQNYLNRPAYDGSLRGRIRKFNEKITVKRMLKFINKGSSVLDCPCGTGRWHSTLSKKSSTIIAIDISPAMVAYTYCQSRTSIGSDIYLIRGDGERLPLKGDSVDYTYCFALMKHLPHEIIDDTLMEFYQVSRKGILCSFALFNPVAYILWKIRNKDPESRPLWKKDFSSSVAKLGLKVKKIKRITPLLGLECVVFLEK